MRIFSNHAHIYSDELAPKWKPILGTVDNLLRFMDEVGIDRTVAFAHDGGDESFDTVKWLSHKIKNIERIIPFGVINPHREDAKEEVIRMHEYGFKGIKMHPCVYKFSVISKEAYRVYEEAQKYNMFLVFHTGPHWYKLDDYRPILFDKIAWDFPELRMSLEHVGGRAFFYEAIGVIQNHFTYKNNDNVRLEEPNGRIFAGLANVFKKEHSTFFLGRDRVKELYDLIGSRHMIFGLDFPHMSIEDTKYAINCINEMDIAEEEKKEIFGDNLKRILKLQN
jgi:uncharacterized protein